LQHDQRNRRYRQTYNINDVDRIIFCYKGELLADLVVEGKAEPTEEDLRAWDKTLAVYLISQVRIFENRTTHESDYGLHHNQWGTAVPEEVYNRIIRTVGIEETLTHTNSGVVRS